MILSETTINDQNSLFKILINYLLKSINDTNGVIVAYSIAELEIIQRTVSINNFPNLARTQYVQTEAKRDPYK